MIPDRRVALVPRNSILAGLTYADVRTMLDDAEGLETQALRELVARDADHTSRAELLDALASMIASGQLLLIVAGPAPLVEVEIPPRLESMLEPLTAYDASR